jgi:MFS family permease
MLNLRTSAAYLMMPFIAMTVGCLCGGVLSDWITRRFNLRAGRCLLPAVALALAAAFLVMGSRAPQAGAASTLLACGAACPYPSTNCYWAVALYADTAGSLHHTKTALLRRLLDEQSLDPATTFMVGDRNFDIDAARANGVTSIAVTYAMARPRSSHRHAPTTPATVVDDGMRFLDHEVKRQRLAAQRPWV